MPPSDLITLRDFYKRQVVMEERKERIPSGQRNWRKHSRGFQTMTLKRLVESLFVDFLYFFVYPPKSVGFINSHPHSFQFIFPRLRLTKDS